MATTSDAQRAAALTAIGNVSRLLRDAIRAAIPTAPEQYMTISIPGTVIDTRSVVEGGTLIYDATRPFIPTSVRQEEARLVDKMLPLANVMVGNTGKSVSRSYARALDCLIPRKAEVQDKNGAIRSPGEPSYNAAMAKLTAVDPVTEMTMVDVYIMKQKMWTMAQAEWDTAKIDAQKAAMADPDNVGTDGKPDSARVRQAYNDWNQQNYRKFKYAVQARWMDWVTNGHKYDVEYNFGLVDVDSIMARIEESKQSMRNSTIVDSDGANELQIVNLTPRDWATQCRFKALNWYQRNGKFTVEQIDSEISRLQRLRLSFEAMKEVTTGNPPNFPLNAPGNPPTSEHAKDSDLQAAIKDAYTAHAKVNKDVATKRAGGTLNNADVERNIQDLALAQRKVRDITDQNREFNTQLAKYNVATLQEGNRLKFNKWIEQNIIDIGNQLTALSGKREEKLGRHAVTLPVIAAPVGDDADHTTGTNYAAPGDELADPKFGIPPPPGSTDGVPPQPAAGGQMSDPWTTINASFSAKDQQDTSSTSSWGMSVGGGAGWGLWSVGGSYSHDQSQSDSTSDMSQCDVSVNFSAMVVNVDRPWLYAELFNDFELDVANDVMISPGAQKLRMMMEQQSAAGTDTAAVAKANNAVAYLAQYNNFPAFPTSFIVAADTVLEFTGNTSHIEKHFSAQSNSGSVSVGWGPFSVSSSFHQSSSRSNFQMQTTATGVRLSFGAPSIIGWVSQILPELPRDKTYEPMIQNTRPTIKPTPPTV